MEQDNLQPQNTPAPEEEIDLLELAGRLWQRRKFIIKAGIIGAAAGLVVAFSIPKEYSVTVTLSPESGKSSTGGLASAASMLGLGNISTGDADALNISLFPDILASDPFALELYEMPVTPDKGETLPLNEYMKTQRVPWWKWLMRLPGKAVRGVMSLFRESSDAERELDPFRLTPDEAGRLRAIKDAMSAVVDKKSSVTTITVTMQDAVVAATVADSVVDKLQTYITNYRTKKAKDDFRYLEELYRERQKEYYDAQQQYATYVDGNKSLYTHRSMVEGERLQNDMNQAYQIYNQVAAQLQVARAKIQEAKPIFAVVNPATVPVRASSPKKMMILAGFIFLACAASAAWVLFGESIWEELRESAKAATAAKTPATE